MKKIIRTALILSVVIFLAGVNKSFACSCVLNNAPLETQIQKAFGDSSAIFSGEVLSIEPKTDFQLAVKIKTIQTWKGETRKEFQIETAKDSGMCGYNFEVGKKYLVYASGESGNLSTGLCTRTAYLDGQSDVKYLNKLARKADDTTPKIRLKNGVAVSGTLGGEAHDSYVIHVRKGQTLKVQTDWKGNRDWNVEFFVSTSDDFFESDKSLRGTATYNGKNWWMKMRKTGEYYIYVTAHPTVDYTIKATVK